MVVKKCIRNCKVSVKIMNKWAFGGKKLRGKEMMFRQKWGKLEFWRNYLSIFTGNEWINCENLRKWLIFFRQKFGICNFWRSFIGVQELCIPSKLEILFFWRNFIVNNCFFSFFCTKFLWNLILRGLCARDCRGERSENTPQVWSEANAVAPKSPAGRRRRTDAPKSLKTYCTLYSKSS